MNEFKFGIMGAGGISNKFADAVKLIDGAKVSAIAARSVERARSFADRHGIEKAYGGYSEMLENEKLDCVYIGTVTGTHHELTMLCLQYGIPVICEKAMFLNSRDAREAFALAKEKNVFLMEAMWSRFVPTIAKVKEWIDTGRIGKVRSIDVSIGFKADPNPENRYFNKALGGGVSYDIAVYAYELATYFLGLDYEEIKSNTIFSETGVDIVNSSSIRYKDAMVTMFTTFLSNVSEEMIIYGELGRIYIPRPHMAERAKLTLYGSGEEEFVDTITKNGFIYETEEVIKCIGGGKLESSVVPWELTLSCAKFFDLVYSDLINRC